MYYKDVFMTPNMLNTYVAEDTLEKYKEYAAVTADYQNHGKMDLFMNSAIANAKRLDAANQGKTPSKAAPGTKVYELVEKLKPYLEE